MEKKEEEEEETHNIYIYIYDSEERKKSKSIEKDEGINRRHIGTWDFNAWYVRGSFILVN